MPPQQHRTTEAHARLDQALADLGLVSSRSQAQKQIKSGQVQLNGQVCTSAKAPLAAGDLVAVELAPPAEGLIPQAGEIEILFEDADLLVVNKPAGMVVHPSAGHDTDSLVNLLLHHCSLGGGAPERPGIVHRLDKDTSGVLVVAKNPTSHQALSLQFKEKTSKRLYLALCWGVPEQPQGTVNQPLGRHRTDRKKRGIVLDGKEAVTHWKLLEDFEIASLIQCRLETGRTHQVRVHMASIGHPVLGDPLYGRVRDFSRRIGLERQAELKGMTGQALHAKLLGFRHPTSGEWMEFETELPPAFTKVLQTLRDWILNES